MATYLQHVRLMEQLQAAANWRQVGQAASKEERGSQLVSCRSWLIFHFFHTWRKHGGGSGARKQPGKPNITKHTTSAGRA